MTYLKDCHKINSIIELNVLKSQPSRIYLRSFQNTRKFSTVKDNLAQFNKYENKKDQNKSSKNLIEEERIYISQTLETERPHGFWNDRKQQRIFFDKIKETLDLKDWTDWYNVTSKEVIKLGGSSILSIYKNSLRNAVMGIYPEHNWEVDRFHQRVSKNYWTDHKNQRKFLDQLFIKLKLKNFDDWYKVTQEEIEDHGGVGLLHHFGNSSTRTLMYVYPEHDWKLHNFTSKLPKNYWKDKRRIKEFFDQLAKELNISTFEDWYKFTEESIKKQTPTQLWVEEFSKSHILSLIENYPEHRWKLYNFKARFPRMFFSDKNNAVRYLNVLGKQLGIRHWEDWYYITIEDVLNNHGNQLLRHSEGSLMKTLIKYYPEHAWDSTKRYFNGKSQFTLLKYIRELFPELSSDVFSDYMHPDLRYKETGESMELDIYLPKLSLAFEFQGQQHYENNVLLPFNHSHNIEKSEACKNASITLIEIPYWWDKSIESLTATIHSYRPDLILNPGNAKPISESVKLQKKMKKKRIII